MPYYKVAITQAVEYKIRRQNNFAQIFIMRTLMIIGGLLICTAVGAQVDTINTNTASKLNMAAFKEGRASYAVYFEDSSGNRTTSADLWDRSIRFSTNSAGQKIYSFDWKWYRRDSLQASVNATGYAASLAPITHDADYGKRGSFAYRFADNVATIPSSFQKTAKDSAFRVSLNPAAFEFPMDLEIFPLLPFKKIGQQFAIAFYEPGSPKSDYYKLTVTGKEDLPLPGAQKANCWLLRIDYRSDSYATFWISDKTREVLKMKEYFRGRYRYKVRLY